jgi:ABC-type nitrate/sulfonate/bicarbonate transport system substrate-binding protein
VISLGYCHELLIVGNMGWQKRTNPVIFSPRAVRKIVYVVILVFVLFTSSLIMGAEPKKVRIGFTTFTMEQLPYQLAKQKGYFKDEGLNPEFIKMSGPTIDMAIASEDILYSSASTSAIRSGVSGIAAKVLWVGSGIAIMVLMVKPEIKGISDLKGKRIGVARVGSSADLGIRAMLKAKGVDPRDVTIISIGSTETRLVALKAGSIDAAPLTVPANFHAEAAGLKSLNFIGDYLPTSFGGLGIHSAALNREPKIVEALVRIGLKGLRVMKQDKAFTVDFMRGFSNLNDKILAEQVYDSTIGHFTDDGILSEKEQKNILEMAGKELKVEKSINPGIFDFSIARKVNKDLDKWRP